MYSDKVMDHFNNPRNVGKIENPDGFGQVGNPQCGDITQLFLKIENDIIKDAKFLTFGCGSNIATSSILTELIIGKTIEEAERVSKDAIAEALDGLPAIKMHCSVLAKDTLEEAIKNYKEKKMIKCYDDDSSPSMYRVIETTDKDLFNQIPISLCIDHTTETIKFLCANDKEITLIETIFDIELEEQADICFDYFRVMLVDEEEKQNEK
jgi:nitrogen fixation NifU-like protein